MVVQVRQAMSSVNVLPLASKGRNILFNDALNTFYIRLYGVGHMAKGRSAR